MMKKVSLVVLFLSIFSFGFSQFELGPRVGLGTVYTNVDETTDNITSGDAEFGFSVGVFTRFGTKKVKLMPELLYSTSTNTLIFNEGDTGEQIVESELSKIDVPVSLQLKPISFLNLQGGLIGSYLVEESNGIGNNTDEAISNYKDFTLGYQAGVGLELGSFLIDLKYESSMGDISDSIGPFEFDERQSMIKGMLGIKLF